MEYPKWIRDAVNNCVRLTTNSEDAARMAIVMAIEKCAAVANAGRMYAEGDIRSVAGAVRGLMHDDDPWGEETR
jgi:hypothetical protein